MSYFLDEEKTWLQRDFGLDRRLIKAISKLGFTYPTLVQSKCIPIALQGKDILCRAKTGAGKTIAFALPVLQRILSRKGSANGQEDASIKCIILAPTKELVKQIDRHINDLIYYSREVVSVCALIDENASVQSFRLQSKPDIVVTTPARLVQNLRASASNTLSLNGKGKSSSRGVSDSASGVGGLDLSKVELLVIDEADLVLSFGYAEDVHSIISHMPKIFQGLLMSATLSAELDKFKRVVLHKPAVLRLEEPQGAMNLVQYYVPALEKDKYLILYVFIKLGLLQVGWLFFMIILSLIIESVLLWISSRKN